MQRDVAVAAAVQREETLKLALKVATHMQRAGREGARETVRGDKSHRKKYQLTLPHA